MLSLGSRAIKLATLSCVVGAASLRAQETIQFSGYEWSATGAVEVASYLGREALMVRTGQLRSLDSDFQQGVIEFDVALTDARTFTGVAFRLDEAARSSEEIYLRPHNSGRFDAVQYTPVYNGISAWQLYPEYNASYDYPWSQWISVRLEIFEDRMVATTGADTLLTVDRLRGPPGPGRVALQSSFPAQAEQPGVFPVAFSNIRISPAANPTTASTEPPRSESDGFIRKWSLSPSFGPGPDAESASLPTFEPEDWLAADTDHDGRLNIAKFRGLPPGANIGTVLARVILESPVDQTVQLGFGFSDLGAVYLNGRRVFSANNTYLTRSGRYLGIMTSGNDTLFLPLAAGENELVFAVTESFGGWGLVAHLDGETPLQTHPR